MLVWIVSLLVFLPLYTSQYLKYENNFYTKEELLLVISLNKVIDAMFRDAENVNIDGMLGMIIAEAQLNLIIQNIQTRNILFHVLVKLKRKCHHLNKLLNSTVRIPSSAYEKVYNKLLNANLWEKEMVFKNSSLLHLSTYNWVGIPYSKLMTHNGSPNALESEHCINELLDFKTDESEENSCIPSLKCMIIMSQLQKSNGYPLTHKLLYVQVAKLMKCKIENNIVENSIRFLCSRILQEFRTIELMKTKSIALQDLYFEQMVLCGIEGFTEFLTFKSRENLLSWQSKYGCYGKISFPDKRWRYKRDISYMKHGCESHITGLAAAAVAVNLNFIISMRSEEDLKYN